MSTPALALGFPIKWNPILELTADQLAAASACGCVLTSATDDQVRRLSMQRRIFQIGGLPHVVARDGFFETHSTLAELIEKYEPADLDRSDGTDTAPNLPQVLAPDMEASAAIRAEAVTAAEREGRAAPLAKPRKARTSRPKPPFTTAEAATIATNKAKAPNTDGKSAAFGATPAPAPKARVVRRRAGQPPTPRWMTAGKERRGRLK